MDKLESAWKKLKLNWESSKQLWDDKARRDFEQMYWTPTEKQTLQTERAIKQLTELIKKARHEVR